MGDSSENPWSHNPNAPQIPYSLYFAEKINFAGYLVGAVFYGGSIPARPHTVSLTHRFRDCRHPLLPMLERVA